MSLKLKAPTVFLIQVAGTSLFNRMIFTMYMLFQVDTAELTALQLVLVGTALEATVMIFEIPTGVVADLVSRRLSIIIGTAIIGVAFIVQAVPLFPVILLGSCLWGLGWTFNSGAFSAWIFDEAGEERATDLFLQASQIGQVVGIIALVPSVALGLIAPSVAIVVGGVGYLLLAIFFVFTMPEENFTPKPREERIGWREMFDTARDGFSVIRAEPVFIFIIGVTLFTGLYSEAYDRLWAKHLIDNIGLTGLPLPVWFGLMRLVGSGLGLLGATIARRIKANTRERVIRTLMWLYGGMVLMLALFSRGSALWFSLSVMWAFDMMRSVSVPVRETWINQRITDSSVRATVISIDGQTDALGQLLGGPPLGFVGQRFGVRAALTSAAALLVPAIGLLGAAQRRSRKSEAEVEPAVV